MELGRLRVSGDMTRKSQLRCGAQKTGRPCSVVQGQALGGGGVAHRGSWHCLGRRKMQWDTLVDR